MAEECSFVWTDHILLVCLSADGRVGFHLLATVNDAALSICVQVFVWMVFALFVAYLESENGTHMRYY